MSTDMVVYDDSTKALIRKTLARDASPEQFEMFLEVCSRTGLNPFAKQIYAVIRKARGNYPPTMTIQVGIDGLRLIAQRTGEYEGQTAPEWCGMDGVWRDVWLESDPPAAARVGVRRRTFLDPVYGIAKYDSFVQMVDIYDGNNQRTDKKRPNEMWARMPDTMLAKCAESAALRKAFPQELSGLHAEVEGRAGDYVQMSGEVERPSIKKPKSKKALVAPDPSHSSGLRQDILETRSAAVDVATGEIDPEPDAELALLMAKETEGAVEGDFTEVDAEPAPKGPSYPEPFNYEEEQAKNAVADDWGGFYNQMAEFLKALDCDFGTLGMALNCAGNVAGIKAWHAKNKALPDRFDFACKAVLAARP